jgi:hypothetical protein
MLNKHTGNFSIRDIIRCTYKCSVNVVCLQPAAYFSLAPVIILRLATLFRELYVNLFSHKAENPVTMLYLVCELSGAQVIHSVAVTTLDMSFRTC